MKSFLLKRKVILKNWAMKTDKVSYSCTVYGSRQLKRSTKHLCTLVLASLSYIPYLHIFTVVECIRTENAIETNLQYVGWKFSIMILKLLPKLNLIMELFVIICGANLSNIITKNGTVTVPTNGAFWE
jgi:hypothetical protein